MSEREQLKLHDLAPPPGSKKDRIRVGRGEGGRRGKTAGRGTKGLKARNSLRPGFEGGQMPIVRRLPKLGGFTNVNKEYFAIINVGTLAEAYAAGSTVTIDDLKAKGLVKHKGRVKVLGEGEISHAITVHTHAISGAAREKIEAAGGTVELVNE
ncbi:MAG: 50S ribosomal protein L15 [Acidimicrobiia bacterium]|nr:50S ribosomal protein L15 [Acidimicrobiia bacterium]